MKESNPMRSFPSPGCDDVVSRNSSLLETILDSLTHPFYVIDVATYHIRLANRAARQANESGTATCYALTHGRDTACDTKDHPCPVKIISETGRPTIVEHVHREERGNPRDIEVHAFPILDDAGKVTQVIEYCVDVTDRKQAEQEIRKLNEELEQRVLARTTARRSSSRMTDAISPPGSQRRKELDCRL